MRPTNFADVHYLQESHFLRVGALPFSALRRSEDPLVPVSSFGASRNRLNLHRSLNHRGCRYAAPRCPQLRIHEIFVIFSRSRDRRRISVTAFDPSKKILSPDVNISEPEDCIAEPLGQPETTVTRNSNPGKGVTLVTVFWPKNEFLCAIAAGHCA